MSIVIVYRAFIVSLEFIWAVHTIMSCHCIICTDNRSNCAQLVIAVFD